MNARAHFTRMQDSTQPDWQIIGGEFMQFAKTLPDRVLAHLKLLDGDYGGFPVDRSGTAATTSTWSARFFTTSATRWAATTTPTLRRPSSNPSSAKRFFGVRAQICPAAGRPFGCNAMRCSKNGV